ncbi:MAG: elongation factor P [Deltaproteobacteria bacterium]|nr:elongation factor P [Deltaproteobacteria bacterium]
MLIAATGLRTGMIIEFNKELYRVLNVNHVTPGNWRGMVQTKLKNIKTDSNMENRFRSLRSSGWVSFDEKEMEYLYKEDDHYVFMDTETYEQFIIGEDMVGDEIKYIVPNSKISISFYEGKPISVELPLTVDLEVVETEPNLKTATITNTTKPAKLETGLVVQVPPFIDVGTRIKVDTSEGKYIERVQTKK